MKTYPIHEEYEPELKDILQRLPTMSMKEMLRLAKAYGLRLSTSYSQNWCRDYLAANINIIFASRLPAVDHLRRILLINQHVDDTEEVSIDLGTLRALGASFGKLDAATKKDRNNG